MQINQFKLGSLRFYLHAAQEQNVWPLYELIFNHTLEVALAGEDLNANTVVLPKTSLKQVGFGRDEGMFPYSARSFPGYRSR